MATFQPKISEARHRIPTPSRVGSKRARRRIQIKREGARARKREEVRKRKKERKKRKSNRDSKRQKGEERRGSNNAGVKTRRNLQGGEKQKLRLGLLIGTSLSFHFFLLPLPPPPLPPPSLPLSSLPPPTSYSSCAAPVFSLTGAKARVGRARSRGSDDRGVRRKGLQRGSSQRAMHTTTWWG